MQSWESNVTRVCKDHGKQGYLKQGQEHIDTERETERERDRDRNCAVQCVLRDRSTGLRGWGANSRLKPRGFYRGPVRGWSGTISADVGFRGIDKTAVSETGL